MNRLLACFLCLFILTTSLGWPVCAANPGTFFDDSGAQILLGNSDYYQLALRKENGSITSIVDLTTGQQVSPGSRYECLWGVVTEEDSPQFIGGCHYNSAWPNHFSYSWSATEQTLTLTYTPDPAATQQVQANVLLKISEEPWFDLHLAVTNHTRKVVKEALFPTDLVFLEDEIQEALLPILPGTLMLPGFFDYLAQKPDHQYVAKYPGYPGMFADYVSLKTSKGQIAIYSLYGDGPIHSLALGFIHDTVPYIPGGTYYYHSFGTWLPDGAAWQSPWVRVRVSQDHAQTVLAYREDNGLDHFASLAEKLGARYEQIVRSPLYKADADQLGIPFSQYQAFLAQVPYPGMLHLVAYQPGGHDENYPDFLPPDPAHGTTASFAAMFWQAQARGFLVMPYTNPTWWDDESPTLKHLPGSLQIRDLAVLNAQGQPVDEYYGVHYGYVMSPYPTYVRQRLCRLGRQMTVTVPSNLLFEDQIGARPWLRDFNPSAPYAMSYIQGWQELLAWLRNCRPAVPIETELGFDRLAEIESGFHGSVVLPQVLGYTSGWWGENTWRPYPLATMLVRDKALFYQHDLAPETFTTNKAQLAWNLAMGYQLSYDLVPSQFGGGLASDWLKVVGAFQHIALWSYAGERLTGYASLAGSVTQTSFETCTVVANWDDANPYTTDGFTLASQGALLRCGGQLTAGVFTGYNSQPLSLGDHYLIEQRSPLQVTIWQPKGADTDLTLAPLSAWLEDTPLLLSAYTQMGESIANVPFTRTVQGVSFHYQRVLQGKEVAYYRLRGLVRLFFLPFFLSQE